VHNDGDAVAEEENDDSRVDSRVGVEVHNAHVAASGEDGGDAARVGVGAVEASKCWPWDPEWMNARCASDGLGGHRLRLRQLPLPWQGVVVQREDQWKSWGTTPPSGSAVAAPFEPQPPRPFGRLPARLWHSPQRYSECPWAQKYQGHLHFVVGEQVPNVSAVGQGLAQVDQMEDCILYSSGRRAWAEFSIGRPELLVCWLNLPPIPDLMDCGWDSWLIEDALVTNSWFIER
jgi:hypothetical protein